MPKVKKRKNIFLTIGKIAGVLIGFLIILLVGIFIFIQTNMFNNWALDFTINKLNKSWESKDNKVNAESLEGNILKGIKLNNGSITVKGDTLVKFASLEIKYDLWSLLRHKINLDYIILNTPRINMLGAKDSAGNRVWNYSNLFGPSTNTDTISSPFDWDVSVDKFKIEDGYARIVGEYNKDFDLNNHIREKLKEFDLDNLDITNLQLELNAKYSNENKSVNIVNLSFNTNSDLNLKKLSLVSAINIRDTVTDLSNLEIVTDRSAIKINKVNVKEFNPLNGVNYEDFKDKNIDIDLDIARFNFADLKFFLPGLDFLDSSVALKFDANGKYGNMNISALNLNFLNSTINLNGNIQNLQDPENLYFDVTASDLNIQPADVLTVLKGLHIPDYSNIGPIQGNIYYKGTVNNFYSEYNVSTGAGNVKGQTTLNLKTDSYNGYLTAQRLNVGKIIKNNKLNSDLNLTAKFDGDGFALNKMSSKVDYSLNNSSIAGYNISSSQGSIHTNRGAFDFDVKANTSAGNGAVNGKINISNIKDPVYVVKGKVGNLDISKFTRNANDKSNINLAFNINGRGSNLNNINGKYNFEVGRSTYSQYQIPQTPLDIQINNSGNESSLSVVTNMADIKASGTFNIGALSSAVMYNVKSFNEALTVKINPGNNSVIAAGSNNGNSPAANVNFKYEIVIKDSARLNETLQPFGIVFNGAINGDIENSSNGFKSNTLVKIKDFRYNDSTIIIRNVNTDFSFNNDYSTTENNSLSPFIIKLNTTGDKIVFGNNEIDSAKLDFDMQRSIAEIRARAKQDTSNSVTLAGNFDMSGEKIIANIDSLKVKYGKYEAENNNTWIVSYLPGNEINFDQFAIKSRKLVVNVKGIYSIAGSSDLNVEADTLPLKDIFDAVTSPDTSVVVSKYKYPVDGNITVLKVNYKGTLDNPELNAIVSSDVLKYDKNNIGTINAKFNYKEEVLTPDISLENYNNKGGLEISGKIPYSNPMKPQDSAVEFINNPVALKLTANDFQIDYFTKLVPSLGDLRGVLKGEINAAGTASDPQLTGNLAISNGGYFFPLLGMDYGFNMKVSTADSKLLIDRISLLNPNDDSKHFDIYGNIDFKGLKINNIDLEASGDMAFLDNSVEANELGIYGSLEGGSGTPPISIKGNLQKLDVSGQFLIKDATISSVPLKGSGYDVGPDNFVYINASDSTYHTGDSLIAIGPKRYERTNPFEKYKYRLRRAETSVWDFLNMDVNVKTEKDLNIDISFITLARSQLYGTVKADLNLKTENKKLNAYGNVEVTGNSYFRLYRDFKLKNSRITFNGPITNPSLDLRAVYSGTKTVEQYGAISSIPVKVAAFVKGSVDTPKISFKLIQDGDVITGENAGGDAVTFLLFGKFKSDLTESQQSAMASGLGQSVGSYYASSYLTDALREVLPFIVGADFKYSEGDVIKNTDIQVTSEFGDATVKVGGHEVNNVNYLEFTIDYPISKLLNLNLPETLLLEIAREMLTYTTITTTDQQSRTGIKLIYKFRF